MILGNKCDLDEARVVSFERGKLVSGTKQNVLYIHVHVLNVNDIVPINAYRYICAPCLTCCCHELMKLP